MIIIMIIITFLLNVIIVTENVMQGLLFFL